MTEQTDQQGRGGPSDRPPGGAPDPERTQALPVEGTSARTTPLEGPSARTVPLDGEARPVVAGVSAGRGEPSRGALGERPGGDRLVERGPADRVAADRVAADRGPADRAPERTAAERPTADRPAPGRPSPAPAVSLGKGESRGSAADGADTGDAAPRSGPPRTRPRAGAAGGAGRQRRARLRLRSVDPWSVFVLALLISLFLAVVLVVAVVALYAVLQAAGVPDSINALYAEVTRSPGGGEPEPLLSAGRALTAAGVLAVVNVVLVTALATLSAVLYNLCASFTGGVEVTLAEHDS